MYQKVDGKEKLKYYHFMSLYLWVKKQGRYPKSLPEFHNYVDPADLDQCIGVRPSSARSKPSRAFIQGEGQIDLCIVRSPCDQDQLVQTVVSNLYLCNQMNPGRHLVNPGNLGGCG